MCIMRAHVSTHPQAHKTGSELQEKLQQTNKKQNKNWKPQSPTHPPLFPRPKKSYLDDDSSMSKG